jgi:hypothetical protein
MGDSDSLFDRDKKVVEVLSSTDGSTTKIMTTTTKKTISRTISSASSTSSSTKSSQYTTPISDAPRYVTSVYVEAEGQSSKKISSIATIVNKTQINGEISTQEEATTSFLSADEATIRHALRRKKSLMPLVTEEDLLSGDFAQRDPILIEEVFGKEFATRFDSALNLGLTPTKLRVNFDDFYRDHPKITLKSESAQNDRDLNNDEHAGCAQENTDFLRFQRTFIKWVRNSNRNN